MTATADVSKKPRLHKVRAGLVAPQMVLRAGCPVVVIPATARGR